jgi:hypothetical protein
MYARQNQNHGDQTMRTIEFHGQEHPTVDDAIVELNFTGDHAISLGGRFFTITTAELHRLETDGIVPTTWHIHEPTGRLMSVPGKH